MVMDERRPPSRGSVWWVVGSAFAVVVLAAGALTAAAWLARHVEIQDNTYEQGAPQITIDLEDGDVTLRPTDPGVTAVSVHRKLTWSWSKPKVSETWDGQGLHVKVDCPVVNFGPGCSVDYTIAVPSQVRVIARTSVGDVTVNGLHGDLSLTTSTGDISVSDATGQVSLRTSTGNISASGLAAESVDAHASTGDVTLRFSAAPSSATVSTSTGDIMITVPSGEPYRVSATTSIGDVRVRVAQDPASSRSIDAHTSTGDIRIAPA
jgi:Putative adhesin